MRIGALILTVVLAIALYVFAVNIVQRIAEKEANEIIKREAIHKVDSIISHNRDSFLLIRHHIDSLYREIGRRYNDVLIIQKEVENFEVPQTDSGILRELKILAEYEH